MTSAERLIEKYEGRAGAAKKLGVSVETIRLWLRDGIPLEKALLVENMTEGFIPAEVILREAREREQITQNNSAALY